MRAKKRRGASVAPDGGQSSPRRGPRRPEAGAKAALGRGQDGPPQDSGIAPGGGLDSPNLSAIERASFMEGLQLQPGNPLHSTALEEDLNVAEGGQMSTGKGGRTDDRQTLKSTVKQHGAAMRRKETESDQEEEEEVKKKKHTTAKTRINNQKTKRLKTTPLGERGDPEPREGNQHTPPASGEGNQQTPPASRPHRLVGKRRSVGPTSLAQPVTNQQRRKSWRDKGQSGSGKSIESQTQDQSDAGSTASGRKHILSSDEEIEDESWKPSPKKAKNYSVGKIRKSSSEGSKSRKSSSEGSKSRKSSSEGSKSRKSSSDGSESRKSPAGGSDEQRRRDGRSGTELQLVLDAFLLFCDQYRDAVESEAVKQAVGCFSSNVRQQLLEKINSYKEFRHLKRENAKVSSSIRKNTQRLLEAKYELMRAQRRAGSLQREKDELELRSADLRRGQAFLHDIRELNRRYLDVRRKHPREQETYGATSLPALLLEAEQVQSSEQQLRGINNHLEEILKNRAPRS
ncbi:centromere protein U isoform X2 [Antennarius striatus]|uniref:centromere protein U isoform X2 n=1 Tax=Antennarius striatus TaxID=241820 RepID=UPI0035B29440